MATILVVDDEPEIRRLLCRWIAPAGHETTEAGDAEEALAVMKDKEAAVVFCDIQMPGQDGLWLTRQLRTTYPAAAVILATSVTSVPPTVSLQSGVMAYLVKPFKQASVVAALEGALAWHFQATKAGTHHSDPDELESWLRALDTNL